MSQTQGGYILQSNSKCTTSCCPTPQQQPILVLPSKKEKKFIHLTINRHKQPVKLVGAVLPQPDHHPHLASLGSIHKSEELFKEEKSSFLEQIRNYSPEMPTYEHPDKQYKSLDTTKELSASRKNQENPTLSTLLQSLSNEIFSQMFVSSAVKGKVVLSGSLGSISEVKSEMQLSNQTEMFGNYGHHTQQK